MFFVPVHALDLRAYFIELNDGRFFFSGGEFESFHASIIVLLANELRFKHSAGANSTTKCFVDTKFHLVVIVCSFTETFRTGSGPTGTRMSH